ncbi:MAG: PIG-L deacetylase family protein [bacterium]
MNVLAIGAHPDDIEFGCGGTLLKLSRAGHNISQLVMTSGECGGNPEVRRREQEAVSAFLGATEVIWGNQKDTKIPVDNEVIGIIDNAIKRTAADLVFFNHDQDTHQDHRSLAFCAMSATRYTKWALAFEVPTSANFTPSFFVDIAEVMDDKLKLLSLHASQIDKMCVPHLTITENALACAGFRGFQGKVKYAEGFMPIRFLMDW